MILHQHIHPALRAVGSFFTLEQTRLWRITISPPDLDDAVVAAAAAAVDDDEPNVSSMCHVCVERETLSRRQKAEYTAKRHLWQSSSYGMLCICPSCKKDSHHLELHGCAKRSAIDGGGGGGGETHVRWNKWKTGVRPHAGKLHSSEYLSAAAAAEATF